MANNRSMQAKVLKHRKAKRKFPKHYQASYISVGMPPDRQVMAEYKERNKSLAFDAAFLAFLDTQTRFHGTPPGRAQAKATAEKVISEERMSVVDKIKSSIPQLLFFNLPDANDAIHRASVFFNSDKTCFVLMYQHFQKGYVRRSITYASKERLIEKWKCDQVTWAEVKLKQSSE